MDIERGKRLRERCARQVNVISNAISPQAMIQRGGALPTDRMLIAILDALAISLACDAWIIGELIDASGEDGMQPPPEVTQ